MQPIALSDYLTTLQAPKRARERGRSGQGPDTQGGESDAGSLPSPQPDFSLEGRAQLAQSAVPNAFGKVAGLTGLPGTLMGLGIQAARHFDNTPALNKGLENLDEQAVANIMNSQTPMSARFSETPGAGMYGFTPGMGSTPYGWGPLATPPGFGTPKTGIGIDEAADPTGQGIAAALADAAAASAAATAAASDATGVGPAGVGGFGDAFDQGGPVPKLPSGVAHARIRVKGEEFVVAPGPAKKYRKLLEAINADAPMVKSHIKSLQEAMTRAGDK